MEPLLIYALGTYGMACLTGSGSGCGRNNRCVNPLSLLYVNLRSTAKPNTHLLTQHTDPEKSLPPLLTRQQKVVITISRCYQQLHMLAANKNHEYKRLLHLPWGWICRSISP